MSAVRTGPDGRRLPFTIDASRRFELEARIDAGETDAQISAWLDCHPHTVRHLRRRYRLPSGRKRNLSALDVQRMLGECNPERVWEWIREGWLKAEERWFGRKREWLIRHDDVLDFLEDERHWHRWRPDGVADGALREWAVELRGHARYLTVAEVARRFRSSDAAVRKWLRRGRLPGRRNGGAWLVDERDLVAFRAPVEKPLSPPGRKPDHLRLRLVWEAVDVEIAGVVAVEVGRPKRKWTRRRPSKYAPKLAPDEREALVAERLSGAPEAELSKRYGVTVQAIRGLVERRRKKPRAA